MIPPLGKLQCFTRSQPLRRTISHLSMNPWAWNMNANMIYLEAPVGVGFSKGSADDMKHISDDTTSSDNRDALKVSPVKEQLYLSFQLYKSIEHFQGFLH